MTISGAVDPLLNDGRSGDANLAPLDRAAVRGAPAPIVRGGECGPQISAIDRMQHANVARVERWGPALLVGVGRQTIRRNAYLLARKRRRRGSRVGDFPQGEEVPAGKCSVHEIFRAGSAERMTRLNGEGRRIVGVF